MFPYVPNAVQIPGTQLPEEANTPGPPRLVQRAHHDQSMDFTHSAEFARVSPPRGRNRQDFFESVQVVPNSHGSYSVYRSEPHPHTSDGLDPSGRTPSRGGQGGDMRRKNADSRGQRVQTAASANLRQVRMHGNISRNPARVQGGRVCASSPRFVEHPPTASDRSHSRTISRNTACRSLSSPLGDLKKQAEIPARSQNQGSETPEVGVNHEQPRTETDFATRRFPRAFQVHRLQTQTSQPGKDNSKFHCNISNPQLQQRRQRELEQQGGGRKEFSQSVRVATPESVAGSNRGAQSFHESLLLPGSRTKEDFHCSCKLYHSHPFHTPQAINHDLMREVARQQSLISSMQMADEDASSNHDDPRNIFWTPSLSFCSYHHGDQLISFDSLWPSERELTEHLRNSGIQLTVLRGAVLDLCKVAVTCGPTRLLKCLIGLSLVRVDQALEDGGGMLHLACLARNASAVSYLVSAGVSPKLKDKNGHTADQACFCPAVRRQLPARYLLHRESPREGKMLLKPCLQDKDTIFGLAKNPKYFSEIQKKLQVFDFNVNTECDNKGDFLLHIACRGGLLQLPLLMALVKIQGADVELCNAEGMTPLMLAAAAGNCVLCDVLMCLFGADPNKPNPNSGRRALHFAAEGNHRKTVECLIRRGADVNVEDNDGRRPDDTPLGVWSQEDCKEVIEFNRTKRIEMLGDKVRKGNLENASLLPSDLCVVDCEGYTLIMIAAIYNKADTLYCLLDVTRQTINAQHAKTGMTALAIAAQMGNLEAVQVLLSRDANPTISDMESYLPLHHAVLHNQESVVDSLLEYFPHTYLGLYKALRICKRNSIHVKLKSAWDRRQEEIVTPKLMDCAISGGADDLFCLLDEGDNINPKSGSGNWPMYIAIESGHIDVVRLLFEKGGDVRKRHTTTGSTVLHVAARMGHLTIVEFLLNSCRTKARLPTANSCAPSVSSRQILDVNALDYEKRTPLQIAAEKGFIKVALLLLQSGASTAVLDRNGRLFTCAEYEGVRMLVESERERHTEMIMKCLEERSKKAIRTLQEIWLPKFDHNLRSKSGKTPLMAACCTGWLPQVKFLLASAVYQEEDDCDREDDSDADSGVLDPSAFHKTARNVDDVTRFEEMSSASGNFTLSIDCQVDAALPQPSPPNRMGGLENVQEQSCATPPENQILHALLQDVSRPRGLSIYHDNCVSHVCAVDLCNGRTALHYAVASGDTPALVTVLLEADAACLNVQDDLGLSPLHLACQLARKKSIHALLVREDIDLNLRTLDGRLPEEMTTNKGVVRTVQKARHSQLGVLVPEDSALSVSGHSKPSSTVATSVNFEKVQGRYEALKKSLIS